MKKLNKLQSITFLAGGILMVIGAGCFTFMWQREMMCWVFLLGALMFSAMQIMQTYEGKSITITRLKNIMLFADIMFILSGFLMVDAVHVFLRSAFTNYMTYYQIIYNKWVLLLLIGAILEIYTMHRISHELSKEQHSSDE